MHWIKPISFLFPFSNYGRKFTPRRERERDCVVVQLEERKGPSGILHSSGRNSMDLSDCHCNRLAKGDGRKLDVCEAILEVGHRDSLLRGIYLWRSVIEENMVSCRFSGGPIRVLYVIIT
ncbi:uncharacterized protein LOC131306426 isoform X2 [Rhododendron vialii]|uniref:uncharacterized protein LOC131306426 isoform X2 n=1 Tax=Rhododendron vialii TaxID=182163 RepID=UPI00265E416E|nr:uncharacterized protein LOC131306426 isoform X2 [Rhododendron vialii]